MRTRRTVRFKNQPIFIIIFGVILLVLALIQARFDLPRLNLSQIRTAARESLELRPDEKFYGALHKERRTATYAMDEGETFQRIADKLGVSVESIIKLNPGIEPGRKVTIQVLVDPTIVVEAETEGEGE
jgi:hypothetical protein